MDTGDGELNERIFDTFAADQPAWNGKTGLALSFERLDERRACRFAGYHPVALDDPVSHAEARTWAVETLASMYDAMNSLLRTIAAEIRQTIARERDAATSIAHDPATDTQEQAVSTAESTLLDGDTFAAPTADRHYGGGGPLVG